MRGDGGVCTEGGTLPAHVSSMSHFWSKGHNCSDTGLCRESLESLTYKEPKKSGVGGISFPVFNSTYPNRT